ncbi:hypothetical protein MMC07_000782 [Pseudocyphellaria aurata]|nr:hypothetical protein [Pseudocyphellaria aurata]
MSLHISLHRTSLKASPRSIPNSTLSHLNQTQTRCASLLKRPKRPYTFTQLVTLSDGSSFTHRTTSPAPVYRSIRDSRNTPLWNPSSQRLLNIEQDEAGKLRTFRDKFGRGWDVDNKDDLAADEGEEQAGQDDNLIDLITGFRNKKPPKVTRAKKVVKEVKEVKEEKDGKGKEQTKGGKTV